MRRFTYKVVVDVPDDSKILSEEFMEMWGEQDCEDVDPSKWFYEPLSPEVLSRIVMSERLGCDEDYGFDYTVDYTGPFEDAHSLIHHVLIQ